jgi:hypothetical protein
MSDRRYTREEVDAILGRAIRASQTEESGLTHDELISVASEIGISAEAIDRAALELRETSRIDQETAELRRKQVRGFLNHLVSFVMLGAVLAITNLYILELPFWVVGWALVGWGLGLAMHLRRVLLPDLDRMRRQAQARIERRERRAERKRQQRELHDNARELGAAVTKGLASVAKAAAAKLEEELAPHHRVRVGSVGESEPRTDHVRRDDMEHDESSERLRHRR